MLLLLCSRIKTLLEGDAVARWILEGMDPDAVVGWRLEGKDSDGCSWGRSRCYCWKGMSRILLLWRLEGKLEIDRNSKQLLHVVNRVGGRCYWKLRRPYW